MELHILSITKMVIYSLLLKLNCDKMHLDNLKNVRKIFKPNKNDI